MDTQIAEATEEATDSYEERAVAHDPALGGSTRTMRILVAGASGMIGSAVAPYLAEQGHKVTRLVRRDPMPGEAEVRWDPDGERLTTRVLKASMP